MFMYIFIGIYNYTFVSDRFINHIMTSVWHILYYAGACWYAPVFKHPSLPVNFLAAGCVERGFGLRNW